MTVGCPVCFVEYEDEPERCEACGYRFTKPLYVADDDLMRALRADAGLDPDDFDDYRGDP